MRGGYNRVIQEGQEYISNFGERFEVVKYYNSRNIWIRFLDNPNYTPDLCIKVSSSNYILKGSVRNPYRVNSYGGIFGIEYSSQLEDKRLCPFYNKWKGILERCFSKTYHKNKPTYKDCCVSTYFKYFPNFKNWCLHYLQDLEDKDITNYEIDKDLIFKGNKVYSEITCNLIPRELNVILTNRKRFRGDYKVGVTYHQRDKHFRASISIKGKIVFIGSFDTEDEAFLEYKNYKEDYLKHLGEYYYNKGLINKQVKFLVDSFKVEELD